MADKKSKVKFKKGDKIVVRQIRSTIGRPKDQKATLHSMGLGKIGHTTTQVLDKTLYGKINKIWHLVEVNPQ